MNIAILIPELGGGGAERVAQILGDYYVGQVSKLQCSLDRKSVV